MSIIHHLYDPCERFFFHLLAHVPVWLKPYFGYLMMLLGVILYVYSLYLLGKWCESKGQRFWVGVWLGLLTGPVIGAIFIGYLNESSAKPVKAKPRAVRPRKKPETATAK